MTSLRTAWKKTLRLPKTSFPPRAVVADRPKYIKRCTDDLYSWQSSRLPTSEAGFTLTDGPPYANGSLHIGHALNKILKDIICRYHVSEGTRVDWVPGWDCHGLPIELKALQEPKHKPNKLETGTVSPVSIRNAARKLAAKTVEEQKKAFRHWAIMADWDNAWKTMDKSFEMRQLEVFREMVKKGFIYRRFKPVYWSPSSCTALAEAELEYRDDHESTTAFVKYPLRKTLVSLADKLRYGVDGINAVIWTTTPWTLPANRAIGFHKDIEYIVVESATHGRLLLAASRLREVEHQIEETLRTITTLGGDELVGATYDSPVFDQRSSPRPFLHADFVSERSGSGLVHLAPGHGMDDYELCQKHHISAFAPLDDKGCFTNLAYPEDAGYLSGQKVLTKGNKAVLDRLLQLGYILGKHKYQHKYPYDWRSKQPVITRATEQWFANVGDLQGDALQALEAVTFIPAGGKSRLEAFIKNRTEWCISRQRAWGVPIPALYHCKTNEAVLTEYSIFHIISIIKDRGIDAWWTDDEMDPEWTPPPLRESNGQSLYRRGKDTMDVWFDSGTSWMQTKQSSDTNPHVASCYIEGTDQHRGWFQSSLLTHVAYQCSAAGRLALPKAPFETLITHGFALDQDGRKMSKSIGNVISPDEIMDGSLLPPVRRKTKGKWNDCRDAMGPDALRLWVASCDYTTDLKVSQTVLQAINGSLSKYRVTFKLLLGMLEDFDPRLSSIQWDDLGEVHQIALRQLRALSDRVRQRYKAFEFNKAVSDVNKYINADLSSFYFECIKDAAYCGTADKRVQVQSTLLQIFIYLQHMLAPMTPLLVEESWEYTPRLIKDWALIPPGQRSWADLDPLTFSNDKGRQIDNDLPGLMQARDAVKYAQESARNDKKMGDSLESFVLFEIEASGGLGSNPTSELFLRYHEALESLFGVSKVTVTSVGMVPREVNEARWSCAAEFELYGGIVTTHVYEPNLAKCVRCWRYKASAEIEKNEALCERCEGVVEEQRETKPELFD